MYNDLFHIGSLTIHAYGVFIAIGFLFAIWLIGKLARESGLSEKKVVDLTFWALLIGMLGGRGLFVITELSYFMQDPLAIFRIWEGGFVFYGGVILGFPFVIWSMHRNQLPKWKTADILVCGLVLGHAFGRLGCFSAGCCYGKPTTLPWGMIFPSPLIDPSLRGVPIHPTQLYASFSLFILFFSLLYLYKRKKFEGQVALTYFMVYPIIRSVIEVFRGDLIRGFVIPNILSTSQFISIFVFIAAAYVYWKRSKSLVKVKIKKVVKR